MTITHEVPSRPTNDDADALFKEARRRRRRRRLGAGIALVAIVASAGVVFGINRHDRASEGTQNDPGSAEALPNTAEHHRTRHGRDRFSSRDLALYPVISGVQSAPGCDGRYRFHQSERVRDGQPVGMSFGERHLHPKGSVPHPPGRTCGVRDAPTTRVWIWSRKDVAAGSDVQRTLAGHGQSTRRLECGHRPARANRIIRDPTRSDHGVSGNGFIGIRDQCDRNGRQVSDRNA